MVHLVLFYLQALLGKIAKPVQKTILLELQGTHASPEQCDVLTFLNDDAKSAQTWQSHNLQVTKCNYVYEQIILPSFL